MYHPPSKRAQVVQRVTIYSLMSVAVIGVVAVLVFIILGYQFDQNDGRIEQGGLVQFDSHPADASVTIDNSSLGTRTPSKTTLKAGQHFVTMQRDGYKAWQKSINVIAGGVLWLDYVRFVPNDLKPTNVADFATVSSTAVSPDKKWMAVTQTAMSSQIYLMDLSGDTIKQTNVELPVGSFTRPTQGKTQSFTLVKWDPNSRYILTKHVYDDNKLEWLVIDTQNPAASQNITKLLNIDASKIVFSGSNSKLVYAQIGTDVRRIDLGSSTLSRPLAANVAEFSIYKDSTIVFTSLIDPVTHSRSVGYYDEGADKVRVVQTYTDDGNTSLHLAIGEYFRETYFAIAYGDTIKIFKGDLSQPAKASLFVTTTLPGGAQYVSISEKGRFVVLQNAGTYETYDLELKKATTTLLKGTSEVQNELQKFDDYTFWSDRDGMLRLYEFDGANQHDIMPVTPGFSATFSPNARYLYGVIKSNDGMYHLERVRMILS